MSEHRSGSEDEDIIAISDVATLTTTNAIAETIPIPAEHSENVVSTFVNTISSDYNLRSTSNRRTTVPDENISSSNSSSGNNNNLLNISTNVSDNVPSCSHKSTVNTLSMNSNAMSDEANSFTPIAVLRNENTESLNPSVSSSTTSGSAVLECPICLLTCVHPTRLPCGHIFCYLCVKGVANKNHRCAMCRRNIPPEFLEHPQLVNGTDDICLTKATDDGYQWFYEGRNGWWQYDDRTSQDIEDAYKKGEKSCTILVAGYVYIVDLEAMVQQRQNEPSRCRRVKRDLATIPKKGVAGLRIEGGNIVTGEMSSSNYNQAFIAQSSQQLMLPLDYVVRGSQQHLFQIDYQPNSSSSNSEIRSISTIAATDAAIRIASDIIGSTLAHADELTRRRSSMPTLAATSAAGLENYLSGEQNSLLASNSISNSIPVSSSTNILPLSSSSVHSSLSNSATSTPLFRPLFTGNDQRRTIDLIEQTLNDFHALTLRNIIDSSDEELNDGETGNNNHNIHNDEHNINDNDDEDNMHNIARSILATSIDVSSEDIQLTPTNSTTSTLSSTNNTTQLNDGDRNHTGD